MSKTVFNIKFAQRGKSNPSKGVYTDWKDFTVSTPISDMPVRVVLFITEDYLETLKSHPDVVDRQTHEGFEVNGKVIFYKKSLESILGVHLISVVEKEEDIRVEVWHK